MLNSLSLYLLLYHYILMSLFELCAQKSGDAEGMKCAYRKLVVGIAYKFQIENIFNRKMRKESESVSIKFAYHAWFTHTLPMHYILYTLYRLPDHI